jgi:hypothetical protein
MFGALALRRTDLADIFQEIEDDLKHEQYTKLWKRYGSWVIAAAIAVVVATAVIVVLREYRQNQRYEQSASFSAALATADNDPAAAAAALSTLAEGTGAYAALARFQHAGLAAADGDHANAASQYRALADDGSVDGMLRDLARMLWGYHALAAGVDAAEIESGMTAIVDGGGAWRHGAREVLATLALQRGDEAAARERFGAIADDVDAPQAMRARASEALAALGN